MEHNKNIQKVCKTCNFSKDICNFELRNRKTMLYRSTCYPCKYKKNLDYHKKYGSSEKVRLRRIANKEIENAKTRERYRKDPRKKLIQNKKWKESNPEKSKQIHKNHYLKNKENYRLKGKRWAKNNKEYISYKRSLRRSRLQRACFKEYKKEIRKIYKNRPDGYHVDHIIPLKGKNVCGLHVPWNLQYLKAEDNIKKSNKVIELTENCLLSEKIHQ